jgi:hypothetical protein
MTFFNVPLFAWKTVENYSIWILNEIGTGYLLDRNQALPVDPASPVQHTGIPNLQFLLNSSKQLST